MGIRIDALPTTVLPSLEHAFAAMKDGLSVQLTVQQVYDLVRSGILGGAAPADLDTFFEVANAFGDDPDFAATMATALATKLVKTANLSDLSNADTALTNLGFSAFVKTLKAAADAAAFRTLIGAKGVNDARSLVQEVFDSETAYASYAVAIPYDDSIPGIAEGTEVLSVAITPQATGNWLEVEVTLEVGSNSAGGDVQAGIFRDGAANASFSGHARIGAVGEVKTLTCKQMLLASSVAAQTFSVRLGGNTGQTAYLNGASTGRLLGGSLCSTITIKEFRP